MEAAFANPVEPMLALGLVAMAAIWLTTSSWVVMDRLVYDRRTRRLLGIERSLRNPALEAHPDIERSAAVRKMLGRLPTNVVYRMTGNSDLPIWVREEC